MSNEPHITALVRADGSGEVVVDGEVSPVYADGIEGVRGAIIARVTEEAIALNRPVRVATTDLDGVYPLIVHPDGAVDSDGPVVPVGEDGDGGSPESGAGDDAPQESEAVGESELDGPRQDFSDDEADSEPDGGADATEGAESGDSFTGEREPVASDGDFDTESDSVSDSAADENTDAAESPADDQADAAAGWAEGATSPEDSRRSDPVLIPPPPFGIDELAAPAEPAPTDGFVAPPTRRSTFQSFEAVLGFPTGPASGVREDDAADADPATDDERVADLDLGTESDDDRVAETRSGFDVFADGLTFAESGVSEPVRSAAAHGADTDLDLPAPGLNAFSPPADAGEDTDDSAPTLDDFLQSRPSASVGPAKKGWQGLVTRITGGLLSPKPGKSERAHRNAIERVQRSLKGPRTIVVLNPKGGAHKTTATLLIAATFGIHRGGSTLAWDNNETRGTLGWRAQPSRHSNTAVDLLRDLERFADVKSARVGYLDNYVRAQGDAQFDVLASDEDAAASSTIDAAAFRSLHHTLSRFYRVLVIDTGNNMRASNWEAAVEAADQLVVVTTVNEETAASAAWLLDGLRQKGHQDKVSQAVTILSSPGDTVQPELTQRLHSHFAALTRVVLEVPYDPGFQSGGPLNVDVLAPQTREAWLQVTAAVADGL